MTRPRLDCVQLRPTRLDDLTFVLKAEQDPENAPYIRDWTEEQHRSAMEDENWAHLIVEATPEQRRVGHCLLRGLTEVDRSVLLKRIVITEKGRGFGRAAVQRISALTFNEWRMHRLWLDVVTHNTRAQRLYESEGFRVEGTLRDAAWIQGHHESLIVMSILEPDYRELVKTDPARGQAGRPPSAAGGG